MFPGDKVAPFTPSRPNSGYGQFVENVLRHIGAGLNIPFELLMKDFSKTNYSSARAALLEAADICVFASRVEPFGTVFAQSWANKTPVIVSDADGPRQFCRHEQDCLMVERDNITQLRDAIARLAGDKTLQMTLVNNGYQRYLSEFTKQASVNGYLEFYLDILKREHLL